MDLLKSLDAWRASQRERIPNSVHVPCLKCKEPVSLGLSCQKCPAVSGGRAWLAAIGAVLVLAVFSFTVLRVGGIFFVGNRFDSRITLIIFIVAVFLLKGVFRDAAGSLFQSTSQVERFRWIRIAGRYGFKPWRKDITPEHVASLYCLALTMNYKSRSISSLGDPEWIWKECISYLQVESIDSRIRETLRDLLFVDMLTDLWFNTSSNAVTRNYLFESIRKVATNSKGSIDAAGIFAAAVPTLAATQPQIRVFLKQMAENVRSAAPSVAAALTT